MRARASSVASSRARRAAAPPGCDAFYVLAPVPHLDSGTHWPAIAEAYRQAQTDSVSESVTD